jgi:hypothetical protein
MSIKQYFRSAIVIMLIIFSACKSRVNTYENSLGVKPSSLASIDTANYTTIQWQDTVKNFGAVSERKPLQVKFHFTNTGKTVLFVLETLPSCDCIVTDYPTGPILPGEQAYVTAFVNTIGQRGAIKKYILVKTNTKTKSLQQLEVQGDVMPDTK